VLEVFPPIVAEMRIGKSSWHEAGSDAATIRILVFNGTSGRIGTLTLQVRN
jgi:hypothetical protein